MEATLRANPLARFAVAPTVWKRFECSGGSRWTSVHEDYEGQVCNFSGCGCGSTVRLAGSTTSGEEAHAWFRKPVTLDRIRAGIAKVEFGPKYGVRRYGKETYYTRDVTVDGYDLGTIDEWHSVWRDRILKDPCGSLKCYPRLLGGL